MKKIIQGLGTTKNYLDKKIKWDKLTEILDSIRYAPSSGDLQNWKVVVVDDLENKKKLAKFSYDQTWVSKASVVLVVCNDQSEVKRMFKGKADFYSTQNCAAGIQNMLLRATSLGIDSAWIRTFNAERIRSLLSIPEDIKIDALITLGYAKKREEKVRVNELKNVVYFREWGNSEL
ncbi:hypothetical protein HN865_05115 [Candidatus Woesearchaeota archaeon]|jgi:nitroreductase|nr:hypothetical protein [Candidatus Woesearchaeota archaeon]MBT7238198.1 hypothetical protein [Candidatus Woesearchaeota archaeon]